MGAWLALAGAFVVMGGQFAMARRGLAAGLTAYDLVALRFVGAALPATVILLARRGLALAGLGAGRLLVLTALAGSPYALLIYEGLRFAPAAHGAMLIPGLGIVVTTVIGAAWVGERHPRVRYAGVGIVLAGLAVVGLGGAAASPSIVLGDALLTAAGVAWGLFTLLVRRWRLDPLGAIAALSLLSLAYLPVYVAALDPRALEAPVGEALLQAGYHGVLQTVLALAGYAFAVRRLGAGTAAIATAAIPVLGALIGVVALGEWPPASGWIGLGGVCAGIVVANVAPASSCPEPGCPTEGPHPGIPAGEGSDDGRAGLVLPGSPPSPRA